MDKTDDKDLIGWTRNASKKDVRKWIEDNLSDTARYDLNMLQAQNGEYRIRMFWKEQQ